MPNPALNDPMAFAQTWADAWNRRAVEEVLALFADDVTFTSPTALAVTGAAVVHGKAALRDYWNTAMAKIVSLEFSVRRVVWDAQRRELAIIYDARINGSSKSVSENFVFGASGAIVSAEVFHGAPSVAPP